MNELQIDVLQDVVANITDNIVIIASISNLAEIRKNVVKPIILTDDNSLTKTFIGDMLQNRVKDAKNNVYILIADELIGYPEQMLKLIKSIDLTAFMVVIYQEAIDVRGTYINEEIYDVIIINPSGDYFGMYKICRFCNHGNDEVQLSDMWRRGFKKPFQLERSFTGNFHGVIVKMAVVFIPYVVYQQGIDSNGDPVYNGSKYLYYAELARMLNLKWRLLNQKRISYSTIRKMNAGKFDVIGGSMPSYYKVFPSVDFSTYDFDFHNVIISGKPPKGIKWYAIFQPLSLNVWLLIIGSVFGTGFFLFIIRYFDCSKSHMKPSLSNCIWDITKIICQDGISTQKPSASEILILSVYMALSFVLIAAYLGILTSFMSAPQYLYPPIDTVGQLEKSGHLFIDVNSIDRNVRSFFQLYNPEMLNRSVIVPYNRSEQTYLTALRPVIEQPEKFVFIKNYAGAISAIQEDYMDPDGNIPIHFGRDSIGGTGYTVTWFPKHAYFTNAFNVAAIRVHETFIDKYLNRHLLFVGKLRGIRNAKNKNRPLIESPLQQIKLKQMVPACVIALGSSLCSGLLCVFQIVYTQFMKKHCLNLSKYH